MFNRRYNYLLRILRRPDAGDGSDLGGAPEVDTTPADTGLTVGEASAPTNLLEAMSQGMASASDGGQPRDELGRFAAKAAEAAAAEGAQATPAAPVEPAKAALQPEQPQIPEDPTAMPDGLTPKAQERFQKLANTNRELTEWRERIEPQFTAIQQTFQEHGVSREQFDQAVQVIGLINRGDYNGALQMIQQEMQNLAMLTGQSVQVDPLAQHPDLRAAVDGFQMPQEHALELARRRAAEAAQTQRQEAERQQQETQQQAQRAVSNAQQQIDQFCRQMQTSDVDYAAVETELLAAIKEGLLEGVPPAQWAPMVQRQYQLIKKVAASQRTVAPATAVLRPTGTPTPAQAPSSAFEAMWGHSPRA